jgi:hypothetical protein
MKKTLLIITLLLSIKFYSQEIVEFNKGEFSFYLTKDCKIGECKISKIIVFKNGIFTQEIIPNSNDFSSFINNKSIMEIEDMNFDNYIDFRIIKSIPAEYPFPYLYWIYNTKTGLFESNIDYEIIISPKIDYEKKLIISSWDDYLRFYKDYYKLENEIPILIERHITDRKKNGMRQTEIWKSENGEFRLISTELK